VAKLTPTDLNPSVKSNFNSDTAELLGFTREYLNASSGVKLSDNVISLANEIAITSARLNILCTKFDKLLTVQRINEIQRKQIEWAEMVTAKRAERRAKERIKVVKSLRGIDRKIYEKTGELPYEYEERIKDTFRLFLENMKGSE
jgi:hypothetical protein